MSVMQGRGGIPHVFRATIDGTGRKHALPFFTAYLIIRSTAAVRLYFTEADYTANANYVAVPAPTAATPYGEWQGPVEIDDVWLKAVTTADVELVVFQRRG